MKSSLDDAYAHRLPNHELRESEQWLQAPAQHLGKVPLGRMLVRTRQGGVRGIADGDGRPGGPQQALVGGGVATGHDELGAEAEYDDGFEPHGAIGTRDPEDRGYAVQKKQRLELSHA
jgi:hypothetical protein